MPNRFGGVGISLPLNQLGTNALTLQAGEVFNVPPGYFNIASGSLISHQVYDPVTTTWRPIGFDSVAAYDQIDSDGNNYRLANQTGCAIGAVLTNAGSGYTSAPTVTASAGGSSWLAILGPVVSTTVTVTNGGSNYQYPPLVSIQAPAAPGVQATGYATISGGQVTGITITNQGAGYTSPPAVSLINDPRDNIGSGAQAVVTLTGQGTVAAVLCTNHGTPLTTVPTLSFSGGGGSSAAATVLMDMTIASVTYTAGSGYTDGSKQVTTTGTGLTSLTPAYTNPATQQGLLRPSPALIIPGGSTTFSATGQVVVDGGHFYSPTGVQAVVTGAAGTGAGATLNFGGAPDMVWMQQG